MWKRDDLSMNLDLPFMQDLWMNIGGYYKQDGVYFFANSNSIKQSSVLPATGLDLKILPALNLITSRLRLHLLAVWNSKIPVSLLLQSVGNEILERESA